MNEAVKQDAGKLLAEPVASSAVCRGLLDQTPSRGHPLLQPRQQVTALNPGVGNPN